MYKGDNTTVINGSAQHSHLMARYFIHGLRATVSFPDIPTDEDTAHQIVKVIVRYDNGYFDDKDTTSGLWLFGRCDEEKALVYIPNLHLDAQPYGRMLLNEVLGIDRWLIQVVAGSTMSGSDYELVFERFSDDTWTAECRLISHSWSTSA